MYQVLVCAHNSQEYVPFDDLAGAEAFAEEIAADGEDCMILQVLRTVRGVDDATSQPRAASLWLVPGVDFPATL